MTRLLVLAEGQTEARFAVQILGNHFKQLAPDRVFVDATRLDGHYTYTTLKKEVRNLLRSARSADRVTTMVDLYKLPEDFRGASDTSDRDRPLHRVRRLESNCAGDIGDIRFSPYIQLHEFEALVLTNLSVLANRYHEYRAGIRALEQQLKDFESPEHVDSLQPPSRRIHAAVPVYDKIIDGVDVTSAIGLPKLREKCRHFAQWLDHLEKSLI